MYVRFKHLKNGYRVELVNMSGVVVEEYVFDKENRDEALDFMRYLQIEVEYDQMELRDRRRLPCVKHDGEIE